MVICPKCDIDTKVVVQVRSEGALWPGEPADEEMEMETYVAAESLAETRCCGCGHIAPFCEFKEPPQ